MSAQGPAIAEGVTPKEVVETLERFRELMRPLELVASKVCSAYDGELHRRHGYDFCLPMENSIEALAAARAEWAAALAAFKKTIEALP
jgi:hypothetical protein